MKLDHPNLGWMIFLGNRLAWDLFQVYSRQFRPVPFKSAYAATYNEALKLARDFHAGKPPPPLYTSAPEWN